MPQSDEAPEERAEPPSTSVLELGPHTPGRWFVRTRSTLHVWDIPAEPPRDHLGRDVYGTYSRHPGHPVNAMELDGLTHLIRQVGSWPVVGGKSYVVFEEDQSPYIEHWRQSGTILSIHPADSD
jgi:hypothetical protein